MRRWPYVAVRIMSPGIFSPFFSPAIDPCSNYCKSVPRIDNPFLWKSRKPSSLLRARINQRCRFKRLWIGTAPRKRPLLSSLEEVLKAGIDEICVVVRPPATRPLISAAAGTHTGQVQFLEQTRPLGYGHAVHCAREFTAGQPFLHLVGDHLYVSRDLKNCAQQLVEAAQAENCAVSAVQATHESKLPYFGAVGGRLVAGRQRLYEIEEVLEKPTPTEAEEKLIVPGLRAGRYLCFFGMHVLTPAVMNLLTELLAGTQGPVTLADALSRLAARERYLALELRGRRYDIGVRYGLLTAQLALAFESKDREEVLANLLELLAPEGNERDESPARPASPARNQRGLPRTPMTGRLRHIIAASDPAARNQSLDGFARTASLAELLAECADLEVFRRRSGNLYERVRALFFLYAIHRFHLPAKSRMNARGLIPFKGHAHLLQRRFRGSH